MMTYHVLNRFRWRVAARYKWYRLECEEERSIFSRGIGSHRAIAESESKKSFYYPFEADPQLYVAFSEVDPTPEGISAFAERYGLLWDEHDVHGNSPSDEAETIIRNTQARWEGEISAMRLHLGLWRLCEKKRLRTLQQVIRWDPNHHHDVRFIYNPRRTRDLNLAAHAINDQIASINTSPEEFERFTPDDPLLPALTYIQDAVTKKLGQESFPALIWNPDGSLVTGAMPTSLLGVLWLQLARSISSRFQFRECAVCGRWIELSRKGARTSRLFCSGACRSKAYIARQKLARQLYAAGRTLEEIAKELSSSSSTVRRWILGQATQP